MSTWVFGAERWDNLIYYALGGHKDAIVACFFESGSLDVRFTRPMASQISATRQLAPHPGPRRHRCPPGYLGCSGASGTCWLPVGHRLCQCSGAGCRRM